MTPRSSPKSPLKPPDTRLLAIRSIEGIADRGAKPRQMIEQAACLDRRDRAFLMELVYGTLRYRDTVDWILGNFLRETSRLRSFTIQNLRTAVYQIFFTRVPERAVVHEAVRLEKKGPDAGRTPALVNAVLRNILRRKNAFRPPLPFPDPVTEIAVNTSHPRWMVERWAARYGLEETRALAAANNEIPPLTIRVNTLRLSRDDLMVRFGTWGFACSPTAHSPDGVTISGDHSFPDLAPAQGLFAVQDEAAQLVAHLLAPSPGERVLDACAAPGGKATHIAQIMNDQGEVVAAEKDPERLRLLEENIRGLGITSVRAVLSDVADLPGEAQFDRILVDAPCSATGVIRRNPDVKYRHTAAVLRQNGLSQLGLLRASSRLLKRGGVLVYSVCSIEPEECEHVVTAFLKTELDFRIIEAEQEFLRGCMADRFLRTYPHRHGMDGFFGVRLCRNG